MARDSENWEPVDGNPQEITEYLDAMLAMLPDGMDSVLDSYLDGREKRFCHRRSDRTLVAFFVRHNLGYLSRNARLGHMSIEQAVRYEELLRRLAPLLPKLRRAKVRIPGDLQADLEKSLRLNEGKQS